MTDEAPTRRLQARWEARGVTGETRALEARGDEGLSRPFVWEVAFEAGAVSPDEAVGGEAWLAVTDDLGAARYVVGSVESIDVELAPSDGVHDVVRARARVVPEVFLALSRRRGYRIFQDADVPTIARAVLAGAGVAAERVRWDVQGAYAPRAYCVQYDETEWDFLSRLLEFEGIWYTFEHAEDACVMVVTDRNDALAKREPAALSLTTDPDVHGRGERVWAWAERARVSVAKVSLDDYDFARPTADLAASATAPEVVEREQYTWPGGYLDEAAGRRLARVRLDAHRSRRVTASCDTCVIDLVPGARFDLEDHPATAGERLVTAVRFEARFAELLAGSELAEAGPERLAVRVETLAAQQTFRPAPVTPAPRPVGLQTARVTGPGAEEIYTEEHGRVKVQFRWDREGAFDEKTSCWLRVAQGHTTGSFLLPRVGWEVLVDFIDGDPDRPVCLGKLWNPAFPPPAALPDDRLQTHHATVSSPGAGTMNQWILDDAAGSERVVVNAGRDLNLRVENCSSVRVGHNDQRTVGGSRTVTVDGNDTATVGANLNAGVTGSQTVRVGGSRATGVNGSISDAAASSYTLDVSGMETIMVGSPSKAILQVVEDRAIAAATSAASQAADRATAALTAPIAPALAQARQAVGPAARFAGPAAALLGGTSPPAALFGSAAASLSRSPGAQGVADTHASIANMALAGELGEASRAAAPPADAAAAAATGATSGGSGTWRTAVGASVTESIGGLASMTSASGIAFNIAGSLRENVGGARVILARGSYVESVSAAKAETCAVYMVKTGEAISLTADGAMAVSSAGSIREKVSGGYSISAGGRCVVTAPTVRMKASGKITLTCGACSVILSGGKITVTGGAKLVIKGTTIKMRGQTIGS
jgi:type VI secretion system secreted protein VgrG